MKKQEPATLIRAEGSRMNTARKRRPWRILLTILICLSLAALLAYGFRPKPVPVQTASVARGPMTVSVTEEGKTRIRSRYVVYPPAAGYLQRVELRAGAPTQAGKTVLALLTPEPATFLNPRARAEALARIEAAEASVQARRAEARRMDREPGTGAHGTWEDGRIA
jgi:HlyD family secretion protein